MLSQPKFYWHLEVSSKCSLKCSRCPRTEYPDMFKVTELTLDFVKSRFTQDILANSSRFLFCGGQGDPIYCKEFLDILEYIKTSNPNIQINITTNGSYKTKQWWERLAGILNDIDIVIFSIDGWDQESNDMYRANSNYKSILEGMNTLRDNNEMVRIVWSTIIFKFNEDRLMDIRKLAEENGASKFQIVKSSLFGSKIPGYIDDELGYDPLEPEDPTIASRYDLHEREYKSLKKYTPTSRANELNAEHNKKISQLVSEYDGAFPDSGLLPSCLINERGLYVDAEGILYPCSWISHPFVARGSPTRDKRITWDESLFVARKNEFNLHEHSIDDILTGDAWNTIFKSFDSKEKMFVECEQKCLTAISKFRLKNLLGVK